LIGSAARPALIPKLTLRG